MTIEELKIGDQVVFENMRSASIITIDGETPTKWKCGDLKFDKSTLRIAGASSSWDTRYITLLTPERKEKIIRVNRRQRYLKEINDTNLSKLSYEQIETIHKIITGV